MRVALAGLASVVGLMFLAPAAWALPQATGDVGEVVAKEPDTQLTATPAPTCPAVATYAVTAVSGGIATLHTLDGGSAEVGTFAATDSETLAAELPFDDDGRAGVCTWVLLTGLVALDGESPVAGGMIRADVVYAATTTEPAEAFSVGTTLPYDTAATAIAGVRASTEVDMEAEPTGGYGSRSLGSSCSCPACPLGGRFWIPFTVIGIGTVPGGQNCCAVACTVACERLASGLTKAEAWAVGQGMWVLCMVCQ